MKSTCPSVSTCSLQTVGIWGLLVSFWPGRPLPPSADWPVERLPAPLSSTLSAPQCIAGLPAAITKKTPTINVRTGPQAAAHSSSNVSQRACACYNLGCVQLFAVLHFLDGLLQQAVCPSQVSHEGDVSLKRIHQKTCKEPKYDRWD